MIGWLLAFGVSYFFGFAGTFVVCLGLAVFFPRFTQFLFATVVFPVYTLFFGSWAFIIGWLINSWLFTFEAWKTCICYTAIPVALATIYYAAAVRTIGLDKLMGE
jgi:hypothetical protein